MKILFFVLYLFIVTSCQLISDNSLGGFTINDQGQIIALTVDKEDKIIPLNSFTNLEGCRLIGKVLKNKLPDGCLSYARVLKDSLGNRCLVTESFKEISDGVIWDIKMQGEGKPWSVPIETVLRYPVNEQSLFWTSWSDCEDNEWVDPLIPRCFQNREFIYGGKDIWDQNAVSLPLISVLEKNDNFGFTLLESPEDTVLDMSIRTSMDGEMIFRREHLRISENSPIHLQMRLIKHNAEWKAGVDHLVRYFPSFFEPKNVMAFDVAGCGAYSSWEGKIDVDKLRRMGFSFNWRAGFDFPYMGLFLPKVSNSTERWERFHQNGVKVGDGYSSISEMEEYMNNMKKNGFHVLCYFNVTEVGNHIKYPVPPRSAEKDEDLWKDPNDFVYYTEVKNALVNVDENDVDAPLYSNWEGCVVVDPAESFYKTHILEQARRHVNYLPSCSGICIDRLDWLRIYNLKRDDKVSWKNNRPSQAMLLSWKDIMSELGPFMHDNNKVIFANVLYSRLDVMKHIDAIYDEYGQLPYSLNRSALLALKKPLVAWTVSPSDFKPNPDAYIQRHLYLGAFLTTPYPGNDHTILPNEFIEDYYEDYGAMFAEMKGRRWVLSPNTFVLINGEAKVNLFESDSAYIMPIMLGKGKNVTVLINRKLSNFSHCKLIYPGGHSKIIEPRIEDDNAQFEIDLERNCALLVFNK